MTWRIDRAWTALLGPDDVRLSERLSAAVASVLLCAYYCFSMSRDLSLFDSGELALAAHELGLGRPPGQPLHTLLGFIASRVTQLWGSPLLGINLLSAVPAGLSLIPASRIAGSLIGERASTAVRALIPWLLGTVALHESLWEPATRVEVYALSTFGALWAIAWALPLCLKQPARKPRFGGAGFRIGVALGVSASANPVIAIATGIALTPATLISAILQRGLWRLLLGGIAGTVVGMVPYAYLPVTARFSHALVQGNLRDPKSLLRYVTLYDYIKVRSLPPLEWLWHALCWFGWSAQHLLLPLLILGLGGWLRARVVSRGAPWTFGIVSACLLGMVAWNVQWHPDMPDYNGYMALMYWLSAAGAAVLFATSLSSRYFLASAAIALCLGFSIVSPPNPWSRTRDQDRLARTLAERVLHEAPKNAIVISYADYYSGPLFYLQQAERQRPDVAVLAYGLAGSTWYWTHLARMHPKLTSPDLQSRMPREERVSAWLKANADRPVLVESWPLAQILSLRTCAGGLYLRTGSLCDAALPPAAGIGGLLQHQLLQLGPGSPSAAAAIAQVSETVGSGLWHASFPREAHATLLAGVPLELQPKPLADPEKLAAAAAEANTPPDWQRNAALGDPARNLFLAGAIVAASGQSDAAQQYWQAAADLGLPEARAKLEH